MKMFITVALSAMLTISSVLEASDIQDIDWAQAIVNQTVDNLKQLESSEDFEVLLTKTKSKKRRKKKRKSKKRRKSKRKKSRMSEQWSKAGRFYLEANFGSVGHGTITQEELEVQITSVPANSAVTISNYTAEDSSIGFSFGGGYYLKDWLALEGIYSILGSESTSFTAGGTGGISGNEVTIDRSFSALELNGKFAYWMGQKKQFGLYAKPGIMLWNMSVDTKYSVDTTSNQSDSASGANFSFGLGIEYFTSKRMYFGAGLMLYPSIGNDELGSQSHTKYLLNAGILF